MAVDFRALDWLPDGGVRFFLTFTRCEFALKENGYVLRERDGGAKADWGKLASELGADFFRHVHQSGRAGTLIGAPPRKQVCVDGAVDWRNVDPAMNAEQLFAAIRRARNNLVHGGKSGDPERDSDSQNRANDLISEAQWVLEEAIERNDRIKWSFEGRY